MIWSRSGLERDCRGIEPGLHPHTVPGFSENTRANVMHQSIESPGGGGVGGGGGGGGGVGKWPGYVGLILYSTPKCCPAGWGHN